MDEKTRNELALFRFSLIAPLLNGMVSGSAKDYLEGVCAKPYQIPGVGFRELSPNTVRRWLSDYRRFGLEGLKRKSRSDKGMTRIINAQVAQTIKEMRQLYPDKTVTAIYYELLNQGALGEPPVSLSTLQRYLKKLTFSVEPALERKRFTFEFANECWQTDTLVGPYFLQEGKKKRTYLMAFLDDASRLLVHGEFFLEENTQNLQTALKKAILKRGLPKQIFADNGKVFDSLQLRMVCASLGIILSHARPYSPASKGKIERVFRTIRMQFMESLLMSDIHSLEELNARFLAYAESTYNLRPHSSLQGLSPMERYLKDKEHFRFVSSVEILEKVFLREAMRKVNKDATFSLLKQVYEVPQVLIGQSIVVRYDPEDLSKSYVKVQDSDELLTVYPVRPVDNSKIVRRQNERRQIDYAALYGGGEKV